MRSTEGLENFTGGVFLKSFDAPLVRLEKESQFYM